MKTAEEWNQELKSRFEAVMDDKTGTKSIEDLKKVQLDVFRAIQADAVRSTTATAIEAIKERKQVYKGMMFGHDIALTDTGIAISQAIERSAAQLEAKPI